MIPSPLLIRLYRQLSVRRKRQLTAVMVLMLFGAAAEVMSLGAVIPFLTVMVGADEAGKFEFLAPVLNFFGWGDSDQILIPVTMLFASAALFAGFVRVVLTWASNVFVYGLGNDLAANVYQNILYQPYAYHLEHNSSEIVGSINKIQVVVNNVLFHAMRAVVSVIMALFILSALLYIEPVVAFSSMIGIGSVFVGVRLFTARYLRKNSRVIAEMQSKRIQVVQEGAGGIREVMIERAEPIFVSKFRQLDHNLQQANMVNYTIARAPRYVVEALGMVIIAFMALYLVNQIGGAVAALPILGVLALGAQRLLPLMQDMYQAWAHITGNHQVLRDVLGLLELPVLPERLGDKPSKGSAFKKDIKLEGVNFGYDREHETVLEDMNLTIAKGTIVGLVGKTGSGKSTLVDLIMGLLKPTTGTIKIDGRTLGEGTTSSWQSEIAHVPQSIFLQDASIAQNIAFGVDPDEIDLERVKKAAEGAQIDDFIESQPGGYSASVGERGIRISGGQRQRIGIARALYKRSSVLVLDEATSALDSETEAAVMDAIKKLASDITIIIIAHRVSTLAICDTVVRLNKGKILDQGTYEKIVDPVSIRPKKQNNRTTIKAKSYALS